MSARMLLLAPFALTIAGCDVATEIAGDTLQGEIRRTVIAQCEGVAEGAGVAADRVSAVCQCSADKLKADTDITMADISRARVEQVVRACVAETDPDGVGR